MNKYRDRKKKKKKKKRKKRKKKEKKINIHIEGYNTQPKKMTATQVGTSRAKKT